MNRRSQLRRQSALLVIDVQNDYFPGGALPVHNPGEILEPILRELRSELYALRIAVLDWHPVDHCSFYPVGKYPPHCIQDSVGAQLHPKLENYAFDFRIHKGQDRNTDSYSPFFDLKGRVASNLDKVLQKHQIEELVLTGLTKEICVKATAEDANKLGYLVTILCDACASLG